MKTVVMMEESEVETLTMNISITRAILNNIIRILDSDMSDEEKMQIVRGRASAALISANELQIVFDK